METLFGEAHTLTQALEWSMDNDNPLYTEEEEFLMDNASPQYTNEEQFLINNFCTEELSNQNTRPQMSPEPMAGIGNPMMDQTLDLVNDIILNTDPWPSVIAEEVSAIMEQCSKENALDDANCIDANSILSREPFTSIFDIPTVGEQGELDDPIYTCPCGKTFKRKAPYERHLDLAHSTSESHKCPECGKHFGSQNTLTMHMSVHDNVFAKIGKQKALESQGNKVITKDSEVTNVANVSNPTVNVNTSNNPKPSAVVSTNRIITRATAAKDGQKIVNVVTINPRKRTNQGKLNNTNSKTIVLSNSARENGKLSATENGKHSNATASENKTVRTITITNSDLLRLASSESEKALTLNGLHQSKNISNEKLQDEDKTCIPLESITPTLRLDAAESNDIAPSVVQTTNGVKTIENKSDNIKTIAINKSHSEKTNDKNRESQDLPPSSKRQPTPIRFTAIVTKPVNMISRADSLKSVTMQSPVTTSVNAMPATAGETQIIMLTKTNQISLPAGSVQLVLMPQSGIKHNSKVPVETEDSASTESQNTTKVIRARLVTPDIKIEEQNCIRKSARLEGKIPGWKLLMKDENNSDDGPKRKRRAVRAKSDGDQSAVDDDENTELTGDSEVSDLEQVIVDDKSSIKMIHREQYVCKECGKNFTSEKYLSMHSALHGPSNPAENLMCQDFKEDAPSYTLEGQKSTWNCKLCNKTFAQNSSYKNHMRTHSDERPYVCDICSIGFKERYHLKKHQLFKHSTELKEKCRVCGKRFKDSTAVRAHERIHSDVRPYKCRRCGKAFKTSECLWHHENRSKTCGQVGVNFPPLQRVRRGRPSRKMADAGMIMGAEEQAFIDKYPDVITQSLNSTGVKLEPMSEDDDLDEDMTFLPTSAYQEVHDEVFGADSQFSHITLANTPVTAPENINQAFNPNIITETIPTMAEQLNLQTAPLTTYQNISLASPAPPTVSLLTPSSLVYTTHTTSIVKPSSSQQQLGAHATCFNSQPQSIYTTSVPASIQPPQITIQSNPFSSSKSILIPPMSSTSDKLEPKPIATVQPVQRIQPQEPIKPVIKIEDVTPRMSQDFVNMQRGLKPMRISNYTCPKCGKGFAVPQAFQKHMMRHEENRPFRCEMCDIGFKLKVHLKKHNLYRHSDEKPCECKICGKKFKDSSAVRLHERIHSEERPFHCGCGKTFKTKENLWGHQHRKMCPMMNDDYYSDSPSTSEGSPMSVHALAGDAHVSALATIKDNQVIAQAIVSNNKVTAQATIGNNGEVTAHASVISNSQTIAQAGHGIPTLAQAGQSIPKYIEVTVGGTPTQATVMPTYSVPIIASQPITTKQNTPTITVRPTIPKIELPTPTSEEQSPTNNNEKSLPSFETFAIRSPTHPGGNTFVAPNKESMAEKCPTIQTLLKKGPGSLTKLPGIQQILSPASLKPPPPYPGANGVFLSPPHTSSGASSPSHNTFTQDQLLDSMASSREPFLRTPPPQMYSNKSRESLSPYSDGSPVSMGPPSVASSVDGSVDSNLPIIYWDDDCDRKPVVTQFHHDSDTLFHELTSTVLNQL